MVVRCDAPCCLAVWGELDRHHFDLRVSFARGQGGGTHELLDGLSPPMRGPNSPLLRGEKLGDRKLLIEGRRSGRARLARLRTPPGGAESLPFREKLAERWVVEIGIERGPWRCLGGVRMERGWGEGRTGFVVDGEGVGSY